jgi:sugar-specific transcriptional regulator TrmB
MNSLFDFAEIGLETRDRRVYEALLGAPQSSLRKLAADTGINRGSVYESVKKLAEQGLVSSLEVGKQRRYTATEPAAILELIRERRDELVIAERQASAYVKQLQAKPELQDGTAQFAQFYEGTEGVAAVLRDVIATCRSLDTPNYRAISTKDVREFIYENFRNFTQRRIAEKISVRVIAVGKGGGQDELSERRWLASTRRAAPNCYTLIYGNKTTFINLGDGNMLSSIVIDNPGVANLQKELFDRLWETLG